MFNTVIHYVEQDNKQILKSFDTVCLHMNLIIRMSFPTRAAFYLIRYSVGDQRRLSSPQQREKQEKGKNAKKSLMLILQKQDAQFWGSYEGNWSMVL